MCKHIWFHLVLSQVTLLLLTDPSNQCGTSRGGWRRRGSRKMTPLVLRQYIPNVSENTLGASGMAEGKITKDSERYKDLIINYNPEIIFKDEEGTGADRTMTQRCKDKLNTLAISVENTWPGVRLRVTEGWDEDGTHAEDSLHYEGRAVDVTTSDKDRSKYGMLARLAVEAGFDYVFYEARGHIHCSVKSDNSIATNYGGCFAADDTIALQDGSIKSMADLQINDHVLSMTPEGETVFSPVLLFFHQNSVSLAEYLHIHTESQHSIKITPNHLIYFSKNNNTDPKDLIAAFATHVCIGDYLYLTDLQGNIMAQKVVHISKLPQQGIYAPLTKHGTIVVNDIITSCYAHINHHGIAHVSLAPIRWMHSVNSWLERSQHLNKDLTKSDHPNTHSKVHWYAEILHSLAQYVIPHDLLYNS